MHRPNFDAPGTGEKIDLYSASRNRLSRGRNSQELAPMCSVKGEPVSDLFVFRNDVVDFDS
jgi:hypothetical protein